MAAGTLIEREPPTPALVPRRLKKIELTEENIQRVFGMGMDELFKRLAEKFGYTIEE